MKPSSKRNKKSHTPYNPDTAGGKSLLSGDDLAPTWAAEDVQGGEEEGGEGGQESSASLSKREKKLARKRVREAFVSRDESGGAGGVDGGGSGSGSGSGGGGGSGSGSGGAASSGGGGKNSGLPPRLTSSLFQGSDTPSRQSEALWTAFRASTVGVHLTPLEYTTELSGECVSHCSLPPSASLVDKVKALLPHWGALMGTRGAAVKRPHGAPALIILTHSAPRACEIIKELVPLGSRVAKLFTKVEEAKASLSSGPPHVLAVGMPHRVAALLEAGVLSLTHTTLILIDNKPDLKQQNILTIHGVREDWWKLYWTVLHKSIAVEKRCKISLLM